MATHRTVPSSRVPHPSETRPGARRSCRPRPTCSRTPATPRPRWRTIAAAAGVTKLIVYRHFGSKEALYRVGARAGLRAPGRAVRRQHGRRAAGRRLDAGAAPGRTRVARRLPAAVAPRGPRTAVRRLTRYDFRDVAVERRAATSSRRSSRPVRGVGRADALRPPRRRGPQLARPRRRDRRTSRSSPSKPRRCAQRLRRGRRRFRVGRERGTVSSRTPVSSSGDAPHVSHATRLRPAVRPSAPRAAM